MDDAEPKEALLWSLRAKRSTAKCVLSTTPHAAELLILQDEEVAIRERFPDEDIARVRARALREGLLQRGWRHGS